MTHWMQGDLCFSRKLQETCLASFIKSHFSVSMLSVIQFQVKIYTFKQRSCGCELETRKRVKPSLSFGIQSISELKFRGSLLSAK